MTLASRAFRLQELVVLRMGRSRLESAKRLSTLLLFLAAGTPAGAEQLWQNVDSGMSLAQLRGLFPEGARVSYRQDEVLVRDFRLTPDCVADVHIHLASGIVRSVELRGSGTLNRRCSDTVLDALSAKYGDALRVTDAPHIVYRWNPAGVSVKFVRWPSNNLANLFHSWTVIYEPTQQLPL